jgi:hypothetical protein
VLKGAADDRRAKAIFTLFGDVFEDYVCDVLRQMFPKPGSGLSSRLECDVRGWDEQKHEVQIDASLDYLMSVVLCEVKGTWVRDVELTPESSETLLQSLRKQYSVTDKNKGVGQLAREVRVLASGSLDNLSYDRRRLQCVYPVLILHDALWSAPGFGNFIASEFESVLDPDAHVSQGVFRKGNLQVVAPIVITVDDLEILETSVEHFALLDLLRDYSDTHPDRMHSLRDFLASSRYSTALFASRSLPRKAQAPLEAAITRFFPSE